MMVVIISLRLLQFQRQSLWITIFPRSLPYMDSLIVTDERRGHGSRVMDDEITHCFFTDTFRK
ncbi:MAG: hypothetical protein DRR19_01270 [Candidatus Parabeggiatoa sp. nov. 1]|nr:MAG: hypothetical protein DRR19_01270 [Gammaproteobacteria bacterium]